MATEPGDGTVDGKRRVIGRPANTDSAQTRRAILEAASSELGSVGYQRMHLDRVATTAGITRGAIYRYFDSKRDLARAAIVEVPSDFEEVAATLATAPGGIIDKLRRLVELTVETATGQPGGAVNFYEIGRLAEDDPEIAAIFRARSSRLRSAIAGVVLEAERRGELAPGTDPTAIVDAMSGLLWAVGAGASEAPNDTVRRQLSMLAGLVLREPDWLAGP